MELLSGTHDTLFNGMSALEEGIDQERLSNSLKNTLGKLKELHIVHGDYSSCNILVKKPQIQSQGLQKLNL